MDSSATTRWNFFDGLCDLAPEDHRRVSSCEHTPERFLLVKGAEPVRSSLPLSARLVLTLFLRLLRDWAPILEWIPILSWCYEVLLLMWVGRRIGEAGDQSRREARQYFMLARANAGARLGGHETGALTFV